MTGGAVPKRILLVGASGGVGNAVAHGLIDAGHEVLASVRTTHAADSLRAAFPALHHVFVADFADADRGGAQLAQALAAGDGRLDGVIGCAGVNPCGPLETTPLADLRRTLEVNTLANVATYQAGMPYLRRSRGRFIFIGSQAGKVAMPLMGHYAASKFALEGLADVMRQEAGQWGIPVSLVVPGGIATQMVGTFGQALDDGFARMDAQGRENYGAYFEQHQAFTHAAADQCVTPRAVADLVIDILHAQNPEPRYFIGRSVEMVGRRNVLSDREMDAFVRSIMPGRAR